MQCISYYCVASVRLPANMSKSIYKPLRFQLTVCRVIVFVTRISRWIFCNMRITRRRRTTRIHQKLRSSKTRSLRRWSFFFLFLFLLRRTFIVIFNESFQQHYQKQRHACTTRRNVVREHCKNQNVNKDREIFSSLSVFTVRSLA